MADKKEDGAGGDEGGKKGGGKGKLIVILLLLILILGGAGGAAAYFLLGIGKTDPAAAGEHGKDGETGKGEGEAGAEGGENGAAPEGEAKPAGEHGGAEKAEGGEHEAKPAAEAGSEDAAAAEGGGEHAGGEGGEGAGPSGPQFVNVPPLLVNLSGGNGKPRFLRLTLAVEVSSGHGKSVLEAQMPKLIDSMQLYLRTLGLESFNTVAGLTTVRHDLLSRVNRIDPAIGARAVLFQDLMVQ